MTTEGENSLARPLLYQNFLFKGDWNQILAMHTICIEIGSSSTHMWSTSGASAALHVHLYNFSHYKSCFRHLLNVWLEKWRTWPEMEEFWRKFWGRAQDQLYRKELPWDVWHLMYWEKKTWKNNILSPNNGNWNYDLAGADQLDAQTWKLTSLLLLGTPRIFWVSTWECFFFISFHSCHLPFIHIQYIKLPWAIPPCTWSSINICMGSNSVGTFTYMYM